MPAGKFTDGSRSPKSECVSARTGKRVHSTKMRPAKMSAPDVPSPAKMPSAAAVRGKRRTGQSQCPGPEGHQHDRPEQFHSTKGFGRGAAN